MTQVKKLYHDQGSFRQDNLKQIWQDKVKGSKRDKNQKNSDNPCSKDCKMDKLAEIKQQREAGKQGISNSGGKMQNC